MVGCEQEQVSPVKAPAKHVLTSEEGAMMRLGKQKENAYSVENMIKAYENLKVNSRLLEDIDIHATHLYVRFLPKDSLDYQALVSDTTMEFFDFPLDYEIVQTDHKFRPFKYEVLAELFLTEDENDPLSGDESSARLNLGVLEMLEDEALRITGNLEEERENARVMGRFNPKGRITIDEVTTDRNTSTTREVALKHTKVRAYRGFKWGYDWTDANGDFKISRRFRYSVNYTLLYERGGFAVTNSLGIRTVHKKNSKSRTWYRRIKYSEEESWTRATVMNAIDGYVTQAKRYNVKLPVADQKVKLRAKLKKGRSNALGVARHYEPAIALLKRNDVVLYTRFKSNARYETDDLFSLVMHELGHVSHHLKSPINVILSIGIVGESWATMIEYYFTRPYYPEEVNHLDDQNRIDIEDGGDDSWKYTPVFIDMIDDSNQRDDHDSDDFADDDVEGYSIWNIHRALDNKTKLDGVKDFLKDNYANTTERHLDKLVGFYNDIKEDNK
ncbi:hypothetical protein [Reichenbachiella sp. MSK19-1]|uniref:hypothetical protein n=1 Tax=Reichenbachiella sp. MSK19-1 TaxID=1897631 RepID=UPI000E6BB825|nr:hypothetical protein [Reichenbachiella sp. MSK19-1]RJE74662.1 hypothetical protein BGP76_16125 [Reichenbachiella sp. MSK19-1]